MSLKKSPVTFVATSDLCAITKGRAVLTVVDGQVVYRVD